MAMPSPHVHLPTVRRNKRIQCTRCTVVKLCGGETGLPWTGFHTCGLKKLVLTLAFTFLNLFPMNGALVTPLHSNLYNVCGSIKSKNKSSYYFLNHSDLLITVSV